MGVVGSATAYVGASAGAATATGVTLVFTKNS